MFNTWHHRSRLHLFKFPFVSIDMTRCAYGSFSIEFNHREQQYFRALETKIEPKCNCGRPLQTIPISISIPFAGIFHPWRLPGHGRRWRPYRRSKLGIGIEYHTSRWHRHWIGTLCCVPYPRRTFNSRQESHRTWHYQFGKRWSPSPA